MRFSMLCVLAGILALGLFACAQGGAGAGTCGDGVKGGNEECDGVDLGGQDCLSLHLGSGPLKCRPDCTFDTSACGFGGCGNGVREGGEYCDGADFGNQTCATLNLGTGNLACTTTCEFDTSGCTLAAQCGNGVVEGSEECDGHNLDGQTCQTINQGFSGGTLDCNDAQCTFDTSGCTQGAQCGNNLIEAGEQCDGNNLAGATCVTMGFAGGNLTCTGSCQLDTSGCNQTPEDCDNNIDDDSDTFVDCDDADCLSDPHCGGSPEDCDNGVDDDLDTYTDCDDGDCVDDPACATGEICDNGIDDDGILGCDCLDLSCIFPFPAMACLFAEATETDCGNGQDEDLDCLVDCADDDCATDPACGGVVELCDTAGDEDGDGDADCDDWDCVGHASCPLCSPLETIACAGNLSATNANGINQITSYGCPSALDNTGPEAYFAFTAGADQTVTVTVSGLSDDLDLWVVADNSGCDAAACVERSQESGTTSESLDFAATNGTTYYIIVDGWSGSSSSFDLSVTCN